MNTKQLLQTALEKAKKDEAFAKIFQKLDYANVHTDEPDPVDPNTAKWVFTASVAYGGSEGIYIDFYAVDHSKANVEEKPTSTTIGVLKTLYEDQDTMQEMQELASFIVNVMKTEYAEQYPDNTREIQALFKRYTFVCKCHRNAVSHLLTESEVRELIAHPELPAKLAFLTPMDREITREHICAQTYLHENGAIWISGR